MQVVRYRVRSPITRQRPRTYLPVAGRLLTHVSTNITGMRTIPAVAAIAASAALLAACGPATDNTGAVIRTYTYDQHVAYLNALKASDVSPAVIAQPNEAMTLGEQICDAIDRGADPAKTLSANTNTDARIIIDTAKATLCP